jgi:hypothetical protein
LPKRGGRTARMPAGICGDGKTRSGNPCGCPTDGEAIMGMRLPK